VPLHPVLADLGFFKFLEKPKKADAKGRLFADIQPGKDRYYSHNFSKHFSRYLRQIGIKTARTSFHSFRHTFTDAARSAGLEESHLKALLGHADPSVTALYGSKLSIAKLYEDIGRLKFPQLDKLSCSKHRYHAYAGNSGESSCQGCNRSLQLRRARSADPVYGYAGRGDREDLSRRSGL
jgi:hypothetical protein